MVRKWLWHYKSGGYPYVPSIGSNLYLQTIATLRAVGFYDWPRSLWEADHIVPRVEGGSNKLDNLRTLCVPCHKAETSKLRTRLRRQRLLFVAEPEEA